MQRLAAYLDVFRKRIKDEVEPEEEAVLLKDEALSKRANTHSKQHTDGDESEHIINKYERVVALTELLTDSQLSEEELNEILQYFEKRAISRI